MISFHLKAIKEMNVTTVTQITKLVLNMSSRHLKIPAVFINSFIALSLLQCFCANYIHTDRLVLLFVGVNRFTAAHKDSKTNQKGAYSRVEYLSLTSLRKQSLLESCSGSYSTRVTALKIMRQTLQVLAACCKRLPFDDSVSL